MSDGEGNKDKSKATTAKPIDPELVQAKRRRTTARSKFTRSKNVLFDYLEDDHVTSEILDELLSKLNVAYDELEAASNDYLSIVSLDDEEFSRTESYLEEAYRTCYRARSSIAKLTKNVSSAASKGVRDERGSSKNVQKKIQVKKLDPPKFDGDIRKFPTFVKDYSAHMVDLYGDDPYALRSCLSGKALDIVSGSDDDYEEMWRRLNAYFLNPEKLVDAILSQIKSLLPIRENDSTGFISLVETIERCWLDLKKLGLEGEMDTASMVSYTERLLPRLQMREWVLFKRRHDSLAMTSSLPSASGSLSMSSSSSSSVTSPRGNSKFELLLTFLLNEKYAIEYMNEDFRNMNLKDKTANINYASNVPVAEKIEENTTLIALKDAVEELTKCISSGNRIGTSYVQQNDKCWIHRSATHEIKDCNTFLNMSEVERFEAVKKNRACFRCLSPSHKSQTCSSSTKCDVMEADNRPCNKNHHRLIHTTVIAAPNNHVKNRGNGSPLLMLCNVTASGKNINTILDPGATLSLITHRAAKMLKLRGEDVTLEIIKVGNTSDTVRSKRYTLCIRDKEGIDWNLFCYGINEITSNASEIDMKSIVSVFSGVTEEDLSRPVGEMDLLIGVDYCSLLPSIVQRVGDLQLLNGPLGFCVRGHHPDLGRNRSHEGNVNLIKVKVHSSIVNLNDEEIHQDRVCSPQYDCKTFFDIENLGTMLLPKNCINCKDTVSETIDMSNLSIKEEREYQLIKKGLEYDPKGKVWYTSYPWIRDPNELENNFSAALGHLRSCEKRLSKGSKEDVELYSEQINELLRRNFAKKLTLAEMQSYKGPVQYLPHHGVHKKTSISTPLRIVFNSSASFKGKRINDFWAKGPDMLNSMIGVLLRFREEVVAFQGDISKMYNSVRLKPVEQHTHRFLWRNMETHRNPDHYCMITVSFGDRPGGPIAITAMFKSADMKKDVYPEAARVIKRNSFVDDLLKSVKNRKIAQRLIREIEEILNDGGFKIKHWIISGEHEDSVDEDDGVKIVDVEEGGVLGMLWKPRSDLVCFNVRSDSKAPVTPLTKRSALSHVSKIYDPLGLLSPFTLRAKLLMREVSMLVNSAGVSSWDLPLPKSMEIKFMNFLTDINLCSTFTLQRSLKQKNVIGKPMMVAFSDGSQQAYGSCIYVRWKLSNGSFESNLVMAKNRLAPVKSMTIPRIELMGAVMACRLRATIVREMDYEFSEFLHIVDSQIVFDQIHKDSYKFGVFVANRIAEVQNTTQLTDWAWTESHNNVADLVTRPMKIDQLDGKWKHGPDYLRRDVSEWPIKKELRSTEVLPDEIIKSCVSTISICKEEVIDVKRFSVLNKLLRVTSIIIKMLKIQSFRVIPSSITSDDTQHSLNWWILTSQKVYHDWQNQLKRLGPSLTQEGIVVVGRRISGWLKDNWDRENLIVLPARSDFTKLVVRDVHEENHDGIDVTVSKVRRQYWIPGLYRLVKAIKKSCYECRILDKKLSTQVMGVLPDDRLKPSPPFYTTGCDLFGPIQIKDTVKKRTTMKCYGVIFTCFTTRAVYLDVTTGYDTDSFLMVVRRFFSIRGCPKTIKSDFGSQLVSAGKDLKEYINNIDINELTKFGSKIGFNWDTIKSADAPWLNGCTERLIKSVKKCIMSTIGDNVLPFQELQTVLFECANIMNGRPIGVKDSDHSFFCPNDLLLGRSTNKIPVGNYDDNLCCKKRFKFIETLVQTYWKRWQTRYFPTLLLQTKWHVASRNITKGDIVLVQDAKSLKGQWKLAEVDQANPAKDGKVRDVTLRYKRQDGRKLYDGAKDTFINRSVHRLVVIVPNEERHTIIDDKTK